MNARFEEAIREFDNYHKQDPNQEMENGIAYPSELLYARRMSAWLEKYAPHSDEHIQLAVRCQHIGRWEIPRNKYPMDKKGYLQWRNEEKIRHARIASEILHTAGYEEETIGKVKNLVLKKELFTNPDTQLVEDVVCLVFIEYYLEDFAARHPDDKVIDILKKTMKKMTPRALETSATIRLSDKLRTLINKASLPV